MCKVSKKKLQETKKGWRGNLWKVGKRKQSWTRETQEDIKDKRREAEKDKRTENIYFKK